MPERYSGENNYRYGFNKGSEKDDEMKGVINTQLFFCKKEEIITHSSDRNFPIIPYNL